MDKLNLVIDSRAFTIYYDSNLPKLDIQIDQINFIKTFVQFQNELGKKFTIQDLIKLHVMKNVFDNGTKDFNGYVKLPIGILLKKTYPILHIIGDIDFRGNLKKMKFIDIKFSDKTVMFKISPEGLLLLDSKI
ncbi:MAG: hypothetical protein V3575_00965 [Candidatus Absconditabacteria bacterium]